MQAAELYQSVLRESELTKRRELAQQLKALAESGAKDALVPLATLQLFGLNAMQIDTEQALRNAERALAAGDLSGVHLIAQIYRTKDNQLKTRDVVKLAPNDPYCVYQQLRLFDPVAKDVAAAAIEQIRARADTGDPLAQFFVGAMFHNGSGMEKDAKLALLWYQLAADAGNAAAQYWCEFTRSVWLSSLRIRSLVCVSRFAVSLACSTEAKEWMLM